MYVALLTLFLLSRLFLWHFVVRHLDPSLQKIALKRPIERVPLLGLAVHLINFLYLQRAWSDDEQRMTSAFRYWSACNHDTQLLLFPEGTDYTPSNVEKSNLVCDRNKQPRFSHVLAPRSTGFAHCLAASTVDDVQLFTGGVVDVTIGYRGCQVEEGNDSATPQTESALLRGELPSEIHFHVRVYDDVGDPEDASLLLNDIWRKKDMLLERFARSGSFTSGTAKVSFEKPLSIAMRMLPFVWLALAALFLYASATNDFVFYWSMACALFTFVVFPLWPLDIARLEQTIFF